MSRPNSGPGSRRSSATDEIAEPDRDGWLASLPGRRHREMWDAFRTRRSGAASSTSRRAGIRAGAYEPPPTASRRPTPRGRSRRWGVRCRASGRHEIIRPAAREDLARRRKVLAVWLGRTVADGHRRRYPTRRRGRKTAARKFLLVGVGGGAGPREGDRHVRDDATPSPASTRPRSPLESRLHRRDGGACMAAAIGTLSGGTAVARAVIPMIDEAPRWETLSSTCRASRRGDGHGFGTV